MSTNQPKVINVDRTFKEFVVIADPEFEASKRKVTEYEFTRRTFTANPNIRGAYSDDPGVIADWSK